MRVLRGKAEAAGRSLLGVELDEHRLLVADDPGVVAGLDGHHLRGDVVERAPVGVLALDVAAGMQRSVRTVGRMWVDQRKPGG